MSKCKQRSAIWRLYFHPAKFDNFKDEKMPEYKTVSVAQRKKNAGLKPCYTKPLKSFTK